MSFMQVRGVSAPRVSAGPSYLSPPLSQGTPYSPTPNACLTASRKQKKSEGTEKVVWLISEFHGDGDLPEACGGTMGAEGVKACHCSVVVAAIMFQVRAPLGLVLCVSGAGALFTVRAIHLCLCAF